MELKDRDLDDDKYYDEHQIVPDYDKSNCTFTTSWQKVSSAHRTCNIQHETNFEFGSKHERRFVHISSGAFKDAWGLLINQRLVPAVVKTTVYDASFNPRNQYKHELDALVMEQATSSPFVLNMHSYCAYSSIVEAAYGTLEEWIDNIHSNFGVATSAPITAGFTSREILRVAAMMAKGLADAQLFRRGKPTFAHADIKASQYLLTSKEGDPNHPIFKLNDFNRGRKLAVDNGKICPFYIAVRHKGSRNRAPEEYEKHGPQNDKIDVFALGATFYQLLTGATPFEGMHYKEAIQKIMDGVQPKLPKQLESTKDYNLRAIIKAMRSARQFRHEDRPTAENITSYLHSALEAAEE